MDRLERLSQLAKAWDGPMSIAIPIKEIYEDIPIIVDTWLNTPEMRRNVDIHLLFNDRVFDSFLNTTLIFILFYLIVIFI